MRNALHVVDRWIAEVRVVPNVEEVGRKSQLLPLGQPDILDQRKVPVLLVRSAENVPAEIAKVCRAEVRVVDRVALRRIEQRRGGEGVDVQVAAIDAALNAPRSQCAGQGAAAGKTSRKGARSETRPEKRGSRRRIRHRERRARLGNGDAAHGPVPKQSAFDAARVLEEWQVVAVAHHEPVRAIEVREAARSIERGLIVESGIKRGVSGRCGVGGFRECVRGLEIACAPTACERGLQRMIVRISIVGKELEAGVAVDALI